MNIARYKVKLSYDGTQFAGFQRLSDTKRTVQGVLEQALRTLGWKGKSVLAAGRTDAGVHARGQIVAFDLEWEHSNQKLVSALNAHLPQDVACHSAEEVSPFFHPRYFARWRKYQYRFFYSRERHPLRERYALRVERSFDVGLMQKAAQQYIGCYDYAAFGLPYKQVGTTVREVYESSWHQEGDVFVWTVVANSFLLHMVRHMIGLLLAIGTEKVVPEAIRLYLGKGLQGKDKKTYPYLRKEIHYQIVKPRVQWIVPACGLCLEEIGYQPYH